jgi:putative ABC transport system permease protein
MAGVSTSKLGRRITTRWPILFALSEAVSLGLQAIFAYKLRAGLTILGVVMGIMTVTGMSAIVAGLNASMARQIESLGSSVVFVRPWGPGDNMTPEEFRRRKGLTPPEVELILQKPAVKEISPVEIISTTMIKAGNAKLQNVQVFGTTPSYETVHDLYTEKGRFFVEADLDSSRKVAVIGAEVSDALFPYVEAVGKEIFIDGRRFEVIGVAQRRGKFLFINLDNFIVVPLGSMQKRDPRFNFLVADLKPVSPGRLEDAIEQTREALRRYRRLKYTERDNFTIFSQDTFTSLYNQLTGGIYLVMIAISSIGLLVGGVGVMNIMLVSVTERTREIGVRKALGAKKRDILWQFLTEAMTLTAVGGILGIAIGGGIAWLINAFSPFPALVQPTWVIIAFVVSLAVGLFFGLWPAAKAARLDPIEALRYE